MNGDLTIYRRTQHGNAELMARHSDLGPALNSLLMLVNGQRTREELNAVVLRLAAPANSIDMLEIGGYVEPVTAVQAPAGFGTTPPAAPTDTLRPSDDQVMLADSERRLQLYENMIGAVKEYLGFRGFIYHLKVEKAVTLGELRDLISPLGDAIAKAKGLGTANEFVKKIKLLAYD